VIRRRGSVQVRPFDLTPASVIEAAKRIFTLVRGNGHGLLANGSASAPVSWTEPSRLSDFAGVLVRFSSVSASDGLAGSNGGQGANGTETSISGRGRCSGRQREGALSGLFCLMFPGLVDLPWFEVTEGS
jgi:hypothetical protein